MVAVKEAIFPVPLAGIDPMVVLSFVQEYVVVPTVFEVEKLISATESPEHAICEVIGSTCADGFTVIVKDLGFHVRHSLDRSRYRYGHTIRQKTCFGAFSEYFFAAFLVGDFS